MILSIKDQIQLSDLNETLSELKAIADIMPIVEKILSGTQYEQDSTN